MVTSPAALAERGPLAHAHAHPPLAVPASAPPLSPLPGLPSPISSMLPSLDERSATPSSVPVASLERKVVADPLDAQADGDGARDTGALPPLTRHRLNGSTSL